MLHLCVVIHIRDCSKVAEGDGILPPLPVELRSWRGWSAMRLISRAPLVLND